MPVRELVLEAFAAGGVAMVEPGSYEMARANLSAGTPTTWPVSLALGGSWRRYYGGTLLGLSAEVNARPHPLLRFALTASLDQIRFAGSDRDFHAALVTATFTLGLTRDLVLDSVVAWNELEMLLRCQSRLRWRYAPGSDFFLVYQHDLDPETRRSASDVLLAKLTYWWQ